MININLKGDVVRMETDNSIGKPVAVTTKYPTDDIPIAAFNVFQFGAKGDGKTDDTWAFQNAIFNAFKSGGGVVFAPAGEYAIFGNLFMPTGVTLRGDWRNPDDGKTSGIGTLLKVFANKNNEHAEPFLSLMQSSGLKCIAIWYPEQDHADIKPYPWTIEQGQGDNMTVENVTLFNSYKGIKIGPVSNELHYLKNVYGTPLKLGAYLDNTTDIGRLEKISFRPKYWVESGLDGAPAGKEAEQGFRSWLEENGEGIILTRSDWQYGYDITLENYGIGLKVTKSGTGLPNGQFFGLNIFNGRVGLQLEYVNAYGLAISNSAICASKGTEPVAVLAKNSFNSIAQFNNVSIGGNPHTAVRMQGSGVLTFMNCEFDDWGYKGGAYAVEVESGSLTIEQCSFKKAGRDIRLGAGTASASIIGNTFESGAKIDNNSSQNADVKISNKPLKLAVAAKEDYAWKETLPKPASKAVYCAADYGAAGKGKEDDTRGIQKALDDAGKTGGTVYLPAGTYRVDGNLEVPSGVELRGIFDIPHHSQARGSVLLAYSGKGNGDAKPLIILATDSGVTGITVFYPEQRWDSDPIPFPWTIQGRGQGVWAKDVVLVNSYQGIDFGTYESNGHYINYVCGSPLKKGIFVGNNSGEGWVENVQFNPHYWVRSPFDGAPSGEASQVLWHNQLKNLEGIIFGYNANEHVLNTFVFGSNKGMHFISQDGKSTSGTIIGHGTDGSETGIYIDAIDKCEFINTELVVMESPSFKRRVMINSNAGGEVKLFNTLMWGPCDRSIEINSGKVTIQQANFFEPGDVGIYAAAGSVDITNNFFPSEAKHIFTGSDVSHVNITGNVWDGVLLENNAGGKTKLQFNITRSGHSKKTADVSADFILQKGVVAG